MPAILRPEDYDRWRGIEPDPRDLLRPFPAELMTMWPLTPVLADSSASPEGGPNSP